jgi:hypothetical protein
MLERDDRYAGWSRPASWRVVNITTCRACGSRVSFARALSGAAAGLLDRDGGRHAATCADRAQFDLIARQRA